MQIPPFDQPGRFYKGNLHTHSTRSDGKLEPEAVLAAYRERGYDFIALTDHFIPRYDFPVVDTRQWRSTGFTTLIGAELHAPALENGEAWHILAVGLPLDFAPTAQAETGPQLAARAAAAGPTSPSPTRHGTACPRRMRARWRRRTRWRSTTPAARSRASAATVGN